MKKDKDFDPNGFIDVSLPRYESFSKTNEFRWLRKSFHSKLILQQMKQGSLGNQIWEDVEVFNEYDQ